MNTILALVLAASNPACDWEVDKRVDPMTDAAVCIVTSPSAKIAFTKRGTDPMGVFVSSAYRRHGLTVRVDDNPAVYLGHNAYDSGPKLRRDVLPQIENGSRLRVRFTDYPHTQMGEAPICNLPQLLAECGT